MRHRERKRFSAAAIRVEVKFSLQKLSRELGIFASNAIVSGSTVQSRLPQDIPGSAVIRLTRQYEKKIGKPVQVFEQLRI